jgi:hypothetical protein
MPGGSRGAMGNEGEIGHVVTNGTYTWALMAASMRALMTREEARGLRSCETMALKVLKGLEAEVGLGTRQVERHQNLSHVALQSR